MFPISFFLALLWHLHWPVKNCKNVSCEAGVPDHRAINWYCSVGHLVTYSYITWIIKSESVYCIFFWKTTRFSPPHFSKTYPWCMSSPSPQSHVSNTKMFSSYEKKIHLHICFDVDKWLDGSVSCLLDWHMGNLGLFLRGCNDLHPVWVFGQDLLRCCLICRHKGAKVCVPLCLSPSIHLHPDWVAGAAV